MSKSRGRFIVLFVITIIAIAAASSIITYYLTLPPPQTKLDKVLFALDWQVVGNHAPYYPALDLGYYEQNGISATIVRGYGSHDTIRRINEGQADFGLGTMSDVILARAQGQKVKMIAMVWHNCPYGILSLKDNAITNPNQLEGKSIADPIYGDQHVLFPALAQQLGIDVNEVTFAPVDYGVVIPMVLQGSIDAAFWYVTGLPVALTTSQEAGVEINHIMWSDFGWQEYHMGIVTTEKMINENPDLVKRFLEATFKGIEYAFENPEQAAKMAHKYTPELDEKDAIDSTIIVRDRLVNPALEEGKEGVAIGEMDPEKVKITYDIVYDILDPETTISVEEIYTNEFVQ